MGKYGRAQNAERWCSPCNEKNQDPKAKTTDCFNGSFGYCVSIAVLFLLYSSISFHADNVGALHDDGILIGSDSS